MLQFLFGAIFLSITQASFEPMQGTWRPESLGACQCVGGMKDYNPDKGYYFDKVEQVGLRKKISARFSCSYSCRDSRGEYWSVSYIHEEWHWGGKSSGSQQAQWFICDNSISKFTPKYDHTGKLIYYETIAYGPFDATQTRRAEFRQWSDYSCK